MAASILKATSISSPLGSNSTLAPKGKLWKRDLAADLLLTALIDAFSILVIFLLMNFSSSGEILMVDKGMELPQATLGQPLEHNPVVKVEEGHLFLDGKEVATDSLLAALLDLRKKFADLRPGEEFPGIVTVQADRRIKYEFLNQIVLACAHAGFSDIRFAVLMN